MPFRGERLWSDFQWSSIASKVEYVAVKITSCAQNNLKNGHVRNIYMFLEHFQEQLNVAKPSS